MGIDNLCYLCVLSSLYVFGCATMISIVCLGGEEGQRQKMGVENLRTKILDSRGFVSSRILILRGGILRSIGNFPESFSQAILVGRFLVWRLGGIENPRPSLCLCVP